MLTQHKQTQLSKVTKLTQIKIRPSIFTLKTVHPARSAITVTFMSEVKSEYWNLGYSQLYNPVDQNKTLYYK